MRVTYMTCVKGRRSFAEFAIDLFLRRRLTERYHPTLSIISLEYQHVSACRSKFRIAIRDSGSQPSRYDAATPTSRDFADWKRRRAEHAKLPPCVVFRIPHANYPHTVKCATSLSPSEWNYRYYRSRREREKHARLPRENTEGRAFRIHGNCRGWVARCVGRSL